MATDSDQRLGSKARREDILHVTRSDGPHSVEDLAGKYDVTASTIRRDLALLHEQGLLARTYGGAIPVHATTEASLPQRSGEARAEKTAIARHASQLVAGSDAETVILDAGSTVAAMAPFLRSLTGVTMVTNNLPLISELSAEDVTASVVAIGGRLRPLSQGFVGPLAEAVLERVHVELAFLGTDTITGDGELCEVDADQIRLKEIMGRRADRVFVLAHGAKLGGTPVAATLPIPAGWTVVTDASAPPAAVTALRERGVEVLFAPTVDS